MKKLAIPENIFSDTKKQINLNFDITNPRKYEKTRITDKDFLEYLSDVLGIGDVDAVLFSSKIGSYRQALRPLRYIYVYHSSYFT